MGPHRWLRKLVIALELNGGLVMDVCVRDDDGDGADDSTDRIRSA